MRSVIVVSPVFDRTWPFVADHFHALWKKQGPVEFIRLDAGDSRPGGEIITDPASVTRLVLLSVPVTLPCLEAFSGLKEAVFAKRYGSSNASEAELTYLRQKGVRVYEHLDEGFWSQSVAEFALGLTICGLRRIPQIHHRMHTSTEPWNYKQPDGTGRPGMRGEQFGDDLNYSNGTIQDKRIRIIGAGNIASKYASYVHMMGADVSAWDPYASEPCFHRSGARRQFHLDELLKDADIFAPLVPLTESTRGLVTERHIRLLPKGCLVLLVTRADVCHMPTLRERVLNGEIALAADVYDMEPLPLEDSLIGRDNVIHTPHMAGRTRHANHAWVEMLVRQFMPYSG